MRIQRQAPDFLPHGVGPAEAAAFWNDRHREWLDTLGARAVIVDTARLLAYGAGAWVAHTHAMAGSPRWVVAGIVGAFAGTLFGNRVLHKVTWRSMQLAVGLLLIVMALALGAGGV